MKLVVLAALLGGLGVGLGCSHEAKPVVAPDEHPPLPPASGSPIAHLVDDAAELKLRDDQLARLKEIDDELGAKLAAYESALRNGEPLPDNPDSPPPGSRGGLAMQAGTSQDPTGAAGGGAVRPIDTATAGSLGDPRSPLRQPGSNIALPTTTTKRYVVRGEVYRDRTHDVRDAIRRALALLDAAQRPIARRVLTDHGVNPDTGEITGGEPGARPADNPLTPIKQGEP